MCVSSFSSHVFLDLQKAFDMWKVLSEYVVQGALLRVIWSQYDMRSSVVCIAGSKSDLFLMHVGLWQCYPLSMVLFLIFMDRIFRHTQGVEGSGLGLLWMRWVVHGRV